MEMPMKFWAQTQDMGSQQKVNFLMFLLENNGLIDHYVQKMELF